MAHTFQSKTIQWLEDKYWLQIYVFKNTFSQLNGKECYHPKFIVMVWLKMLPFRIRLWFQLWQGGYDPKHLQDSFYDFLSSWMLHPALSSPHFQEKLQTFENSKSIQFINRCIDRKMDFLPEAIWRCPNFPIVLPISVAGVQGHIYSALAKITALKY